MKIKNKKIKILVTFIMIIFIMSTSVYAEINGEDSELKAGVSKIVTRITETTANYVVNSSMASVCLITSALSLILFGFLKLIFTVGGVFVTPLPDNVIFNRVAMFDPNFTSPSTSSITYQIKGVINDTFLSFQSLAIAIFAIAAMVMGIKLAITTIATEKAKYKQYISKWLMGIIILFMLRYIIAGTFYLNEEIVKGIANSTEKVEVTIDVFEIIPVFGSSLGKLVSEAANLVGVDPSFTVKAGYTALYAKHLFQGLGGNILSALTGFIILGQSIAIIITYFKRLFYSILLSIVSPIIVAVDTVNKSMGIQSKILSTWAKEFTITVFTQSLHAIFLAIVLRILNGVDTANLGLAMEGIITIILTTALVKFEKVFKGLFGIRSSMMGDIKGGAATAFKAIHGVRQGVGSIKDNVSKMDAAVKKEKAADKKIARTKYKLDEARSARAAAIQNNNTDNTTIGDTNVYESDSSSHNSGGHPYEILDEHGNVIASYGGGNSGRNAITTANGMTAGTANINNPDVIANAIVSALRRGQNPEVARSLNVNVTNPGDISSGIAAATGISSSSGGSSNNVKTKVPTAFDIEDLEDELAAAYQEKAESQSEFASAYLANKMGPANLIAGFGIGLGAEDSIGDALLTGGYVTKGLDATAEKAGYRGANKARKEMYNDLKENHNIDNEKILPPKSKLVINPMINGQKSLASVLEVNHMIKGTLTQELSKEMRSEIGKAVRDEMKNVKSTAGDRARAHIEDSFKGYKGVISKHNQFKDSYKYMGNKKNSVDNL